MLRIHRKFRFNRLRTGVALSQRTSRALHGSCRDLGRMPLLRSLYQLVCDWGWLAWSRACGPASLTLPNARSALLAVLALPLLSYHESLTSGRVEGIYPSLNSITVQDPIRVREVIHTLGAALMLAQRNGEVRRLLSVDAGTTLGYLSFALYLTQVLVIGSISSFTFDALVRWPHLPRVGVTFCVTLISAVTLALPLAAFDQLWLRLLRRVGSDCCKKFSHRRRW